VESDAAAAGFHGDDDILVVNGKPVILIPALDGVVAGAERSSAVGSLGTPGARRPSLCASHELIRSSQRVHSGDAEVTLDSAFTYGAALECGSLLPLS